MYILQSWSPIGTEYRVYTGITGLWCNGARRPAEGRLSCMLPTTTFNDHNHIYTAAASIDNCITYNSYYHTHIQPPPPAHHTVQAAIIKCINTIYALVYKEKEHYSSALQSVTTTSATVVEFLHLLQLMSGKYHQRKFLKVRGTGHQHWHRLELDAAITPLVTAYVQVACYCCIHL